MKNNLLYIFFLAVLLPSCKKYLDVNDNPNAPTKAPINGLLAQSTYQTALNVFRAGSLTANYVQYFASPNPGSSSDIFEPIDASGTWTNIYNTMTDINDMEKLGADVGSTEHQGVAKILMSINLKLLHDLWGSVPYSEALNATTLTPKFDDAKTLYNQSLALLDEGIALLNQSNSTFKLSNSLDFVHKGNKAAWIKTANALKARYLLLVTKQPSFSADNVLAAVANAYTSNADDAQITAFNIRNPWAQVAVDNAALLLGGFLSTQYVNMMNGTTYGLMDPRLPLIATLTKFGDYRGTRNGVGRVGTGINQEESYISTTGYFSSTTSPLIIISYAEIKFIEAEARFRKGTDMPGAYAAYLDGIRASMNKIGVSATNRDLYVNNPLVSVGAGSLTLAMIMREKYKALFLNPETWNDARRFNYAYKDFMLPVNAALPSFIRRLDYPSVELTRNGANVPTVGTLGDKLWWDQ